jgi:hypothetical protein
MDEPTFEGQMFLFLVLLIALIIMLSLAGYIHIGNLLANL